MKRVAVVADSHWDEHSRFEECKRLHAWIFEDAEARGVDLTLHTGDVYERKSTPLEREAAADWFQHMATLGPVVVVRGNHDAIDDLPLLERLDALHSIHVVQDARVLRFGEINVAAVAWPRKSALLAAFGSQSLEDGERSAGEALRAVFRGLGAELAEQSGPRLLAMHAMVRGSIASTGQPLVGCDLEVGLEDLALLNAHAYLLGHIHKGQDWEIAGAPVVYPGSPRRTAFGESETKGYVVVETDETGVRSWEFVAVPATPMLHVSAAWRDGALFWDQAMGSPRGAEVRLRYTTPSDTREAAAAAAQGLRDTFLAGGAALVKVEPIVLAEQRARVPELARAQTLEEKLSALWEAKGFSPGARREALLDKVHQLEEVARGAA